MFALTVILSMGLLTKPNACYCMVSQLNQTRQLAVGELCEPKGNNPRCSVVPAKILKFCLTCDHRFQDGTPGAKMVAPFTDVWENPDKYF